MATRTNYTATITDEQTGTVLATSTRYAWNSAVTATQDMLREHARSVGHGYDASDDHGCVEHRGTPAARYVRRWTPIVRPGKAPGPVVVATVEREGASELRAELVGGAS